ncbi:MAG: hypothetical protein ACM30H_04540 [Clostridia bacterium]
MILEKIRPQLRSLGHDLGRTGQLALILLVLSGVFYKAAVEPLQGRAQRLAAEVERQAGRQDGTGDARAAGTAGKLDTFYQYLRRDERTTDWLAKLYAIGQATGVELRAGDYRMLPAGEKGAGKIERYEITLPVTGTYAQMRDFLKRSLEEIPVLSLDQVSLKRETRNDGAVHAELKLTLHMVKP